MSSFQFEQLGVIRSPYKEKFAVPRQPGLVKSANGELHLIAPYNQADAAASALRRVYGRSRVAVTGRRTGRTNELRILGPHDS